MAGGVGGFSQDPADKIAANVGHKLFLVMGPPASHSIAFDVLVQDLVRIQLWTISRNS